MSKQSPPAADGRDQQVDERDHQASGAWQWGSTPKTRRVLLEAAREVFTEQGYSQASIADVVERAGSSVGSLYHHFGGKSELFLALWHEHQRTHEEAASQAVARLRAVGVTDTTELFCAGARAFLEGSWLRQRVGRPERRPARPAGHRAGPAVRGDAHLADRRGRASGGFGLEPPSGQPHHRSGSGVRPPALVRRTLAPRLLTAPGIRQLESHSRISVRKPGGRMTEACHGA